jgi:hypothetical protein
VDDGGVLSETVGVARFARGNDGEVFDTFAHVPCSGRLVPEAPVCVPATETNEAIPGSERSEGILGSAETGAREEVTGAGSDVVPESISSKKLGLPGFSSEVSGVVFSVFIRDV